MQENERDWYPDEIEKRLTAICAHLNFEQYPIGNWLVRLSEEGWTYSTQERFDSPRYLCAA